ncbi:MAG: ATP-dependent DNA helicase, partial [Myxococcota bacterium]|nr:ATP-dependent DNA helicase [Myxococcota bacterium]
VIFDEAHQLEDVATDFFGVRVSSARVESLLRDAERSLCKANALEALGSGPIRSTLEGAREASLGFFRVLAAECAQGDSRRVLSDVAPAVSAAHQALDLRLEALEALSRSRGEESLQLVGRRAGDLRAELSAVLNGSHATEADGELMDVIRWIEVRSRSVSLGASPVDVGATLRSRLFDRVPSVVCTSATLATAGGFHFAKARLGAPPDSGELIVASPFDFASRAALYVPDDLPDPSEASFEGAATQRIVELVTIAGGGAFVLCTSTRAMKALSNRLRTQLDLPILVQGEGPKHQLLTRFRSREIAGRAVLVATMSFWEGVDVPGWALRLVVLEKIPFAPPDDPVFSARSARLDREGGNGFTQYAIPSAALMLKQGFGRLIRTQRDAGMVAILDGRILRRGYGRALLASLPPARRVGDLRELRVFWEAIAASYEASMSA